MSKTEAKRFRANAVQKWIENNEEFIKQLSILCEDYGSFGEKWKQLRQKLGLATEYDALKGLVEVIQKYEANDDLAALSNKDR